MTKAKSQITFEEPPDKVRYDWDAIATQLRAKPGEWAKVFENDRTSLATAIRIRGVQALHPDKGFEVRTRNNKKFPTPRTCTLYLRYVPEKDTTTSKKGKK